MISSLANAKSSAFHVQTSSLQTNSNAPVLPRSLPWFPYRSTRAVPRNTVGSTSWWTMYAWTAIRYIKGWSGVLQISGPHTSKRAPFLSLALAQRVFPHRHLLRPMGHGRLASTQNKPISYGASNNSGWIRERVCNQNCRGNPIITVNFTLEHQTMSSCASTYKLNIITLRNIKQLMYWY